MRAVIVEAEWDAEAKVWVATSEDVPGLATEADTIDALRSKLEIMIPELRGVGAHDISPISSHEKALESVNSVSLVSTGSRRGCRRGLLWLNAKNRRIQP